MHSLPSCVFRFLSDFRRTQKAGKDSRAVIELHLRIQSLFYSPQADHVYHNTAAEDHLRGA